MNRHLYSLFLMLCILNIVAATSNAGAIPDTNKQVEPVCTNDKATFECLKKNFNQLYSQNEDLFYSIYNKAESEAQKCRDVAKAVSFIEFNTLTGVDGHLKETIGESVVVLAKKKPQCFLDAVLLLSKPNQDMVIADIIEPVAPDEEIYRKDLVKVFTPYKNQDKYKNLLEPFFSYEPGPVKKDFWSN